MSKKVKSIMDIEKYLRLFIKTGELHYFNAFLDIEFKDVKEESELVRILEELDEQMPPPHKLFIREYVRRSFPKYAREDIFRKTGFGVPRNFTYCN